MKDIHGPEGGNVKIGELAKATNTQIETIRYYEREGLLPKTIRTGSNYRIYSNMHLERLAFIRYCRGLDISLDEIRVLLLFKDSPNEFCDQVNILLDKHIKRVEIRIKELRNLKHQLKILYTIYCESQKTSQCGILSDASAASKQDQELGKDRVHIHDSHRLKGKG